MAIDARDAAGFYASPLGRLTAHHLREKLLRIWPSCANLAVLGLGFTGPYLTLWRETARCIAVSPATMGPAVWPAGRPGLACVAEEEALPFDDLSFDRIIIVHGLEHAENTRRALREAWRLLKDDGRLIVVAPNRRGIWAYMESTPFGHGQPYSQNQLSRLLTSLFFHVEQQHEALFAPPLDWRPARHLINAWEKAGRRLTPQFAGLTIAEATKEMHGLIPSRPRPSGRRVFADASN